MQHLTRRLTEVKKNPPKSVIINTTNDLQTYVADMYADFWSDNVWFCP